MKILIVKTSSLGDVIQALFVLSYLKQKFPESEIDWIARDDLIPLLQAHPLLDRAISVSFTNLIKLKKRTYDLVFDLQGNTKSGIITWISKGKVKVGYGRGSVREWPNLLATHKKYNLSKKENIADFYLGLVKAHFQDKTPFLAKGCLLKIAPREKNALFKRVDRKQLNIMVSPFSKWENKQLSLDTLTAFLAKVQKKYPCHFFLTSGSFQERRANELIQKEIGSNVTILEKMPIPHWQNFMALMDLVIAVDSSGLHLCATTEAPSFSLFGPTSAKVFKPKGEKHHHVQGKCPYKEEFVKQCPLLRTCKTGACIKDLQSEDIFSSFEKWVDGKNILGPISK